jgi:hypothetical protein
MTRALMKTLSLAAAALAITTLAGAAVPGVASQAEARTRVIVVGTGLGFYGPGFAVSSGYGYDDCRWLRRRAIHTGSSYWWSRYHDCRGY